ncbi:MAG: toxin-antitoxin system YwqK family antitoxin [Maribacter dokdonensis]|uniref:toxin-antitoxin system YwqK family antitoxin n=1 Tax=Maribacter dokdonensis TaxID=320912 RepID=UPI003296D99E
MKPTYISEIEELHLEGWTLKEETSTFRVYQKYGISKKLLIFDNYILEENYKGDELYGSLVGRMKKPFLHYPNYQSNIYLIESYKKGLKEGVSESFYDDGSKTRQEWEKDQLNGKWEEWFSNGQKKKEQNYTKGILNGEQCEWYENGQLKLKENFVNGVQVGESLKYLENGKLKRKKFYKNGKIEGLVYELWDFKGKVVDGGVYSETEYVKDIPNGKETVFYPNGNKIREGIILKGEENGERIWYHSNGTKSIIEYYDKEELEGKRYLYDENGNLESTQEYSNGERIS